MRKHQTTFPIVKFLQTIFTVLTLQRTISHHQHHDHHNRSFLNWQNATD